MTTNTCVSREIVSTMTLLAMATIVAVRGSARTTEADAKAKLVQIGSDHGQPAEGNPIILTRQPYKSRRTSPQRKVRRAGAPECPTHSSFKRFSVAPLTDMGFRKNRLGAGSGLRRTARMKYALLRSG